VGSVGEWDGRERERERERALLGTIHNGGSRAAPAHGRVCASHRVGCVQCTGWMGGLQMLIRFSVDLILTRGYLGRAFIERDKNSYYLLQYIYF
jgi:hypothetical protein